ncbi:type II toxin-antitoxin system ParD family antitoxin [Phenylobacterium sp.]|uniref:ribbon-helix-helix domain-containing protein n=1 Tax=Phenylobacterium sp. TaxID=1871053 RepID=UPI00301DA034
MKLELPPELEAIVEEAVKSGRYATALDATREAFLLLDQQEAEFRALKHEIDAGIASPKAPWEPDLAEGVKRRGRERLARERLALERGGR